MDSKWWQSNQFTLKHVICIRSTSTQALFKFTHVKRVPLNKFTLVASDLQAKIMKLLLPIDRDASEFFQKSMHWQNKIHDATHAARTNDRSYKDSHMVP